MDLGHGAESNGTAESTVDNMKIMWHVVIHVVFLLSLLILSISEGILAPHASPPSPAPDSH